MKLLLLLSLFLTGCESFRGGTYSLNYTDKDGASIGGSVTLKDTKGLKK